MSQSAKSILVAGLCIGGVVVSALYLYCIAALMLGKRE
jgi:hypothetical protein